MARHLAFGGVAIAVLALSACGEPSAVERPAPPVPADLEAHSALFEREVLEPVPGIYVAVGFGLANSIMIEGRDGVVIVDVMEGRSTAEAVLAAFREITDKPVAAIVLTHNHADHVMGGAVFAEGRDIPVYAHATTSALIDRVVNVLADTIAMRAQRMFGVHLTPAERVNAGIGPELSYAPEEVALLRPTHVFEDRLEVEVAGVKMVLVHAPGETDDQIFVWLPDRKTLLPGDNIYEAFPNLYTIRGTSFRDPMKWVHSIDLMRDLRPEALAPSHTRPVVGEAEIAELLTAYRDAIQYVHDQSVRGINKGMTPDELTQFVELPPHLAAHPWLQEFYGSVDWSARAVFAGYLGWFDGDPATLEPMAPDARARAFEAALEDGRPIGAQARAAFEAGDLAWATELATAWTRAEPASTEAREVLADVLTARGAAHANPNARHWYLTAAKELRGEIEVAPTDPSSVPDAFLDSLPIEAFMAGMATRLKAEDVLNEDFVAVFDFPDLARVFTIHVRRGVAEVREREADDPNLRIVASSTDWKRLAAGKIAPAAALASGKVKFEGGLPGAVKFLGWFER